MSIEKIDLNACIGCGTCVETCPMDVIRMDKKREKAFIKYPEDCMLCEWCMFDCPTKAITVTPVKKAPLLVGWG